jgi:hypothetical protein
MPAKKKSAKKRPRAKATASKKTAAKKIAKAAKRPVRKRRRAATRSSAPSPAYRTDVQSGDLQGLFRREHADSESVEELLEEGNAFEAGVVTGVEAADDADEREVRTREVPEDDVPGEYLDKD